MTKSGATDKRLGREFGYALWHDQMLEGDRVTLAGPWTLLLERDARDEAKFQRCEPAVFVAAAKEAWLKSQAAHRKEEADKSG